VRPRFAWLYEKIHDHFSRVQIRRIEFVAVFVNM
jgi:hypothetical protein